MPKRKTEAIISDELVSSDRRVDDDLIDLADSMREIEGHLRHVKLALWSIVVGLFLIALPPMMEFLWSAVLVVVIGVAVIAVIALIVWGGDKVASRVRTRRRKK